MINEDMWMMMMDKFVPQKIHNNKIHNVYYYDYLLSSFFDDDVVEQVMFVMLHLFLMILNV